MSNLTKDSNFNIFNNNNNNTSSNSNTTSTTTTTATSNLNNIPLVQLTIAAKASSVAPTTLSIFQNVTNSKFLQDPIDKITKDLVSINTTNFNFTIPPEISVNLGYR